MKMRKSTLEKVLRRGIYDTRQYRYSCLGCGDWVMRISRKKLYDSETESPLNDWEIAAEYDRKLGMWK